MKSTGIVRQIDMLGRIVLPIELRRLMGLDVKDPIEIFVNGDYIMLRKYQSSCIFCGSMEGIQIYEDKNICKACRKEIGELK